MGYNSVADNTGFV